MRYDYLKLENGLELVGEHNPDSLSLAAGFFCRTGARDETAAESGVSHFLEHMLFKGTETLTYDHINKTFDRIGAQYNAFTSEENTVYFGQVLPEFQGDLVGLLAQMMRPALRGGDFDMEKNVILEEIAMYEDRPLWVAHDRCRSLFYNGHPLGQSVLGTTESIRALARDQMDDYFRRRYAPDNLTFAVAGNYDWDRAVEQVREMCGDWEPSGGGRRADPVEPAAAVQAVRLDRFTQATFYLLAPGPSAQEEERYAAAVLAAALGSGSASRLHYALVEPGLAEQATLHHSDEDHSGHYSGVILCEPEQAEEVLGIYRDVLTRAQDDGLTEDEVQRATRRLGSSLVFQAEVPLSRLINVGFDWLYRRRIESMEAVIQQVRAVDAAACNALLQRRPFDTLTAVCVGPVESLNGNGSSNGSSNGSNG